MNDPIKNVCVLGLGYVGLPTASVIATRGLTVRGVDVDQRAVETINRGDVHIFEPDLDVMVRSAVLSGQLTANTEPGPADVFVIAVPTPFREGHEPDLSFVEQAVHALAPHVQSGDLIVLESTSPVGTTEQIGAWLADLRPDLSVPRERGDTSTSQEQVYLAHCPERVLPGRILAELVSNDRVIGGINPASAERAREFYELFVAGNVVLTDCRTAEMCKLAENSFRDVNIAFANEISLICDRFDIDVWELIQLANRHPRVQILSPGPGVGGHCVAVDPWFIVASAPDLARLVQTARTVNDAKPGYVVEQVRKAAAGQADPTVACLGLAFKANVDDLRESPAVEVVRRLADELSGALLVVEPHVEQLPEALARSKIKLVDLDAALEQASIVALLVDHAAFRSVDRSKLAGKQVIDTRGLWR
jgi:UDP-N-acetyl-D-mannosaminuronic acid dehydrogenase